MPIQFKLPKPFSELTIDIFDEDYVPAFKDQTTLIIRCEKSSLLNSFVASLTDQIRSSFLVIEELNSKLILIKNPKIIFSALRILSKILTDIDVDTNQLRNFILNLKLIYLNDEAKDLSRELGHAVDDQKKYAAICCYDPDDEIAGGLQSQKSFNFISYRENNLNSYVVEGDFQYNQIEHFLYFARSDHSKIAKYLPSNSVNFCEVSFELKKNNILSFIKNNVPFIIIEFTPDNYVPIEKFLNRIGLDINYSFFNNYLFIQGKRKVIKFLSIAKSEQELINLFRFSARLTEISNFLKDLTDYKRPIPKRSIDVNSLEIKSKSLGKGNFSIVSPVTTKNKENTTQKLIKIYFLDSIMPEIEAAIATNYRIVLINITPKMRPVHDGFNYLGNKATRIIGYKPLSEILNSQKDDVLQIIKQQFSTFIRILVACYRRKENDLNLDNIGIDEKGNLVLIDHNQSQFHKTCKYSGYKANEGYHYKGRDFPSPAQAFRFTEEDIRNFPYVKDFGPANWAPILLNNKGISIDYSNCDEIKYKWFLHNILVPEENNTAAYIANIGKNTVANDYAVDDNNAMFELRSILITMPEFQNSILAHPEFLDELIVEFEKANQDYKPNKYPELIINIDRIKAMYYCLMQDLYFNKFNKIFATGNIDESEKILLDIFRAVQKYPIFPIFSRIDSLIPADHHLKKILYENMIDYHCSKEEFDQAQNYISILAKNNPHKSIMIMHKLATKKLQQHSSQNDMKNQLSNQRISLSVQENKIKMDAMAKDKIKMKRDKIEIKGFLMALRGWEKDAKLIIEAEQLRQNKPTLLQKFNLFFNTAKPVTIDIALIQKQLELISSLKIDLIVIISKEYSDNINNNLIDQSKQIIKDYYQKHQELQKDSISSEVKLNELLEDNLFSFNPPAASISI